MKSAMGLTAVITAAFTAWIVLWSLGARGFDAFLAAVAILVLGVAAHVALPSLPSRITQKDSQN